MLQALWSEKGMCVGEEGCGALCPDVNSRKKSAPQWQCHYDGVALWSRPEFSIFVYSLFFPEQGARGVSSRAPYATGSAPPLWICRSTERWGSATSSVVVGPRTDILKDNEQKGWLLFYELIPKLLWNLRGPVNARCGFSFGVSLIYYFSLMSVNLYQRYFTSDIYTFIRPPLVFDEAHVSPLKAVWCGFIGQFVLVSTKTQIGGSNTGICQSLDSFFAFKSVYGRSE